MKRLKYIIFLLLLVSMGGLIAAYVANTDSVKNTQKDMRDSNYVVSLAHTLTL